MGIGQTMREGEHNWKKIIQNSLLLYMKNEPWDLRIQRLICKKNSTPPLEDGIYMRPLCCWSLSGYPLILSVIDVFIQEGHLSFPLGNHPCWVPCSCWVYFLSLFQSCDGKQFQLSHLGFLAGKLNFEWKDSNMDIGFEQILSESSTLKRMFMNSYDLATYSLPVPIFCPSMSRVPSFGVLWRLCVILIIFLFLLA